MKRQKMKRSFVSWDKLQQFFWKEEEEEYAIFFGAVEKKLKLFFSIYLYNDHLPISKKIII